MAWFSKSYGGEKVQLMNAHGYINKYAKCESCGHDTFNNVYYIDENPDDPTVSAKCAKCGSHNTIDLR